MKFDTSGMKMDVCSQPEKAVGELYPRLANDPAIAKVLDMDRRQMDGEKAVRYIVIYYSNDSVLRTLTPPLTIGERKNAAAEMAGFSKKNGNFATNVTDFLFNLGHPDILEAVVAFLRLQDNSGVFAFLNTLEQNYWENLETLNNKLDSKDDTDRVKQLDLKNKLRQQCKELLADIEEYTNKFYGNSLEIRAEIERKRKEASIELDINKIVL